MFLCGSGGDGLRKMTTGVDVPCSLALRMNLMRVVKGDSYMDGNI